MTMRSTIWMGSPACVSGTYSFPKPNLSTGRGQSNTVGTEYKIPRGTSKAYEFATLFPPLLHDPQSMECQKSDRVHIHQVI
ncbi:hypothetical protein BDV23DRAFT_141529 [Aspergillus alliaceus]|uniref:Uncharacterized protein n=1 Tax=Petromyces alliaceus TaxID=209559 RepID=A0A5N7BXX8_PETAA|nr:hypothetical protein BDV23DRAFT_141529 [Aspergillus alliaceus]